MILYVGRADNAFEMEVLPRRQECIMNADLVERRSFD